MATDFCAFLCSLIDNVYFISGISHILTLNYYENFHIYMIAELIHSTRQTEVSAVSKLQNSRWR